MWMLSFYHPFIRDSHRPNTFIHTCICIHTYIRIHTYQLPDEHAKVYDLLAGQMKHIVNSSAYNWVRPSLWSVLFGDKNKSKQ